MTTVAAAGVLFTVLLVGAIIGGWGVWRFLDSGAEAGALADLPEKKVVVNNAPEKKTSSQPKEKSTDPVEKGEAKKEEEKKKKGPANGEKVKEQPPQQKAVAPNKEDEAFKQKIQELVVKLETGSEDEKRRAIDDLKQIIAPTRGYIKPLEILSRIGGKAKSAAPVLLSEVKECTKQYKREIAAELERPKPERTSLLLETALPHYLSCLVAIEPANAEVAKEISDLALFVREFWFNDLANLPESGGVPKYRREERPFGVIGTQLLLELVHDYPEHSKVVLPALVTIYSQTPNDFVESAIRACDVESKKSYATQNAEAIKNLAKKGGPDIAKLLSQPRALVPDGNLDIKDSLRSAVMPTGIFPQGGKPAEHRVLLLRMKAGMAYDIEMNTYFDGLLTLETRQKVEARMETIRKPKKKDAGLVRKSKEGEPVRYSGERELRQVFRPSNSGIYRMVISTTEDTGGTFTVRVRAQ
jgi:hypothetical protein